MKHEVIRVDNLMYEGCEPHWKCAHCGECVPFHCYTKEQIEQQECNAINVTKSKLKELEKLAKPLIEFLYKYYDLHTTILVSMDNIKVVQDKLSVPFEIE